MVRDLLNMPIRVLYRCAYLMLRAWWFVRRPQTHGAAVALWHEGKVLLVRTSYRHCYSLPGGFVKRGEPAEQAARRELREELGIDLAAQALQHAWSGTLDFESRRDAIDIWEVTVASAPALRVTGREIVSAGWLSPSDALSQRLFPHIAAYLTHTRKNPGAAEVCHPESKAKDLGTE
jgi:ADP-ribose pyrophosphatase YjhB (NUDIX family)